LRYFCSPHHQDSALYPIITQFERAAGFRREDTPEQRLDKLEAVLGQTTKDLGVAPLLAQLLSIPTSDRYPPLSLTPQKRKEKTFRALVAGVEGLAARQPVLMVSEDVQWADPTSLEVLDLIVDPVPTVPVLLVVTFRPQFAPSWVGRPHVTLLSLSRLPPRQSAEMIRGVTGGKALPKEIAEQIIDRTDGVPLFIEELTKAVVESGMFTDAGDHYLVTGPVAPLAIPTTLHASLLARLDRLAPVREVAQIAAALGRQFSHELISAVALMPQPQLDDALAQLVSAELIYRRGRPPDAEFIFKHALVQDAAYSTLLRSRCQQLHARIAATLESQFREIVAAHPELLAQHCAKAGLIEKAVGYQLKAGQQSVARSAMTEAVTQLQRGLDLLTSLPDGPERRQQELDLQIVLGPALTTTRGYSVPEVVKTFARARALAEQLERAEYLVPLLYGQWGYHLIRSEHRLALSLAEQMEKIGQSRNDVAAELLGRRAIGLTRFHLGEFVASRALFEQCHGLGDPTHRAAVAALVTQDPHASMLSWLGFALANLGYIDQARSRLNEALVEARQLKQAYTLVHMFGLSHSVAWLTRSPHEAQRHAEEVMALSNEHGFPLWLGFGTAGRGWSLAVLGHEQEGMTLLTKGLAAVRSTGAVSNTPLVLMWFAEAYGMSGEPVEGLNCLAEADKIIETTEERLGEAELHRLRGQLLGAAGDQAAAEQNYHKALAVAKRQSAP
jgi:predicted ATPase